MRTPQLVLAILTIATLSLLSQSASAADYSLSSVQDAAFIGSPSSGRDSTNNGNGLRISNVDGQSNVLVQFDLSALSGETITGARIEYYDLGTSTSQNASFSSTTHFIHPDLAALANPNSLIYNNSNGQVAFDIDGMRQDNLTYNSIYGAGGAVPGNWIESPAASLNLALSANNAGNRYYSSGAANSSTLDFLNTANTEVGYAIVLNWRGSGVRVFSDLEAGFAPRLILTTSTIGDFDDSGTIDLGDYNKLLENMQGHLDAGLNPILHEHGDINFDGKVDLNDFGLFKSIYPGGPGALAAALAGVVVPEPSTIVLVGMAGFLALARRRSR